ncbi:hypothetical protein PMAYCL1PPCAC_27881, partial [Pristionchus mayeri]
DIKEEPLEMKDELMDDCKQEEPIVDQSPCLDASSEIKEESLDIKDEPIVELSYAKEEEPNTDDASNDTVNENESVEIKDELVNEFVDVIQDELIADMYCPSTGTSRP